MKSTAQILTTRHYLHQFSQFNHFLWVCWFLCKNFSNFVSLLENLTPHIAIINYKLDIYFSCFPKENLQFYTWWSAIFLTASWFSLAVLEIAFRLKSFLKISSNFSKLCQFWAFYVIFHCKKLWKKLFNTNVGEIMKEPLWKSNFEFEKKNIHNKSF